MPEIQKATLSNFRNGNDLIECALHGRAGASKRPGREGPSAGVPSPSNSVAQLSSMKCFCNAACRSIECEPIRPMSSERQPVPQVMASRAMGSSFLGSFCRKGRGS
jgi:hypothetical protein